MVFFEDHSLQPKPLNHIQTRPLPVLTNRKYGVSSVSQGAEQARDEKEVTGRQRSSISIRDESTIIQRFAFFLLLTHHNAESDIYH